MARTEQNDKRQYSRGILNFVPIIFLLGNTAFISCTQLRNSQSVREKIRSPQEVEHVRRAQEYLQDISSVFNSPLEDGESASDYVITHPRMVDREGRFLSHNVRFSPQDGSQDFKSRRRRDVDSHPLDDDRLYFVVTIRDEDLTLNVSENDKLVHSNFVVERLRKHDRDDSADYAANQKIPPSRSSLQRGTNWPCHFRGHVTGHPTSAVAISTCNGLTGLIRLGQGDFFIEPLRKTSIFADVSERQPHKIYKRDAMTSSSETDSRRSSRADRDTNSSRHRADHHKKKRRGNRKHGIRLSNNIIKLEKPEMNGNESDSFIGREFCGVTDTKRQYRKDLRTREAWEEKRARSSPMTSSRRERRSLSLEHWIEMMVVVDRKMLEYHQHYHEGEVERYVLTIVNMVSELFHDVSIGNSLHVTLIRLIILESDEKHLSISSHAERTLDSFCRWAKRMNPRSDHHANHHDVAVLLTRKNICSRSNKSCETLGLAHVAGMCQSHRSCNVNQDTGLSLAFTVAHELGHNFAMHHDGQLNNCEPDEKYPRVMAPHLTSNSLPMRWSSCSRRYVTRFLDRNWGFCLMDSPSTEHDHFNFSSNLPGAIYDADHQCRLMFGYKSRHCRGIDDICNRLWCLHQGSCRSRLHAAVSGTKCGRGRWCFTGSCVPVGKRPSSVDGSWGSWTKWSRCSRTCGVGVSYSARYCDQPAPRHGGRYCLGERRRYRTCNVWSCPVTNATVSFRSKQCAEFNNVLYRNRTYMWYPVDSPVYPCELHCYTRDSTAPIADRLRDKVVDGTKCFAHGKDICVDGICKRLGCDLKIDSTAKADKCGVCRGDGTSCSEVDSTFDVEIGEEYVQVGLLPKGARNIRVLEANSSGNFLALRNPLNEDDFYLNGNYMIQWDTQFDLAGTVFTYSRINKTLDNITAEGPITHDIMVMLLFVETNPGIHISYIMPHNVTAVFNVVKPEFEWMMQPWTPCSRTCGRGIQMSLAICVERKAGIVEEDFCDEETRPSDRRRICSNPKCPPEWFSGPWQPCSLTCGGGKGRQKRTVLCIRSVNDDEQVVLNRSRCLNEIEPDRIRQCSAASQRPCPTWRTSSWGNCSTSCGSGLRNRSIKCVTYIINDVITLHDDVGSVDDDYTGEPIMERDGMTYNDVLVGGAKDRVTHNLITVMKRRRKKNLLENFDYNVEEDDECDATSRPEQQETCNANRCPSIRPRSNLFDDPSTPSGGVMPFDPLMSIRSFHSGSAPSDFNEDFDVASDPAPLGNDTFGISAPPGGHDYEDLLDMITPHSVNLNRSAQNRSGGVHFDREGSGFENESAVARTTAAMTTTTTTVPYVAPTLTPKWLTGVWGHCSTTCGVGARVRNVICSSGPGHCDAERQPPPVRRCKLKPCASWQYGDWRKCSRACGQGRKRRKVHCIDSRTNEVIRPYHCNSVPRLPRMNATCNVRRCMPWKTSQWSRCNVSCGMGSQRRRVACSKQGWCDPAKKPAGQKNCLPRVCTEWRASHWGRCPVNCGYGIKRRIVQCVETDSGRSSTACNSMLRPDRVKKCNKGPCRVTDYDFSSCTGDRLKPRFCEVLKHWGKCVQPSLAIQCCSTCKTFFNVRRKDKIS